MSYALTIMASTAQPIPFHVLSEVAQMVNCYMEATWLAPGKVAVMMLDERPSRSTIEELWKLFERDRVDILVTSSAKRRKKLLVADMDATIVTGETLDELAKIAGIEDQIKPITARAMRGELEFTDALRERVMLLKDLPETALRDALNKTEITPGALQFVRTMSASGALCVLVSGGFTTFTSSVAGQVGFHLHHGNTLGTSGGKLTGAVAEPILDKSAKLELLEQYRGKLDISLEDTLAIGDGANDIPMLLAAGFGIGYRPKPIVKANVDNCIFYGDLTCALYAQGFEPKEFVEYTSPFLGAY